MLENDAKGWYGAFSSAGRYSAERYHVITHMDQIINRKDCNNKQVIINFLKRNKYSNINEGKVEINDSDNYSIDNQMDAVEENIDIFRLEDKDDKNSKRIKGKKQYPGEKKRNCLSAIHRTNPEAYQYHDKHLREGIKKKPDPHPSCTKYNPKRNFVWPRTLTGPKWEEKKQSEDMFKKEDFNFYISQGDPHENIVPIFIDMNRQSMRGDFLANSNNTRFVKTKPYKKNKKHKKKKTAREENEVIVKIVEEKDIEIDGKKKRVRPFSSARPRSNTTDTTSRPITTANYASRLKDNLIPSEENSNVSSQEDSYNDFKEIYQRQIKKRPQTAKNYIRPPHNSVKRRTSVKKAEKNQVKVKGPDFARDISREYLDQQQDKKGVIPFSLPNFKQVRERPIMMVVYDRPRHQKKKQNEIIQGIEPSLFYDPNKVLDKVNNHTEVHSPNFDQMASRPDDDNPLPSYMKNIFTRGSAYTVTNQSLKMNNYSEGKFRTNYTSFWPKKSFNKVVNLNLLNSDNFLVNNFCSKKEFVKKNDFVAKSMRFYNKNYDDLFKESMLSKFDNVTFKTIKKENKLDSKDVELFLQKLEKTNQEKEF